MTPITYADSGVGASYGSKAEKTQSIIKIIQNTETSKDKYKIGDPGGFAGCFDLKRFMEDKDNREYAIQLIKEYNLTPENYEKRLPYVLLAEWLKLNLNPIKLTA